jgi:hypothetical protein
MRRPEAAAVMSGKRAESIDEHRQELRERLRAEWIAGAEAEWRRLRGRPMTAGELKRLLRRYSGDV